MRFDNLTLRKLVSPNKFVASDGLLRQGVLTWVSAGDFRTQIPEWKIYAGLKMLAVLHLYFIILYLNSVDMWSSVSRLITREWWTSMTVTSDDAWRRVTTGWRRDDDGTTTGWRRDDDRTTTGWRRDDDGRRRDDDGTTTGRRRDDDGMTTTPWRPSCAIAAKSPFYDGFLEKCRQINCMVVQVGQKRCPPTWVWEGTYRKMMEDEGIIIRQWQYSGT